MSSCTTCWLMRCAKNLVAATHTGLSFRLNARRNCKMIRFKTSSPSSGNLVFTTATSAAKTEEK